jgi:plastocyanin
MTTFLLARRPWPSALVFAAACLGVPAGGQAQDKSNPGPPPAVEVTIDNFTFAPAEITIAPGTTVRWVNHDDIPHTVVEAGKACKSKVLDTDDSFSMTFSSSGSFAYFCSLHPHMTGKVIVKTGS